MAAVQTFGTLKDVSNLDAGYQLLLESCDKRVIDEFIKQCLHDVMAFGVSNSELIENLLDAGSLLEPGNVVVWFTDVPAKQDVLDFILQLGVTWKRAAGPQLLKDQLLVSMRVALFYKSMVKLLKAREGGGADGADPSDVDTPIDPFSSKTFASAFLATNDRVVEHSLLAPQNVQGAIKRQFESGVFLDISLKLVILNKEASVRSAQQQMVTDLKSGNTKVVNKSAISEVKSVLDATFRLMAVSYTRVFIGGTFFAPPASFPGADALGVVKGQRYHYCMQAHESYCALVIEVAGILYSNLGEFIYRFSTLHKRTHTMCQTQAVSFAHGQRETMKDMFSFMRALQPRVVQAFQQSHVQVVKEGSPKQLAGPGGGKRSYDEIAQLPGFIKGIRTFGGGKDCPKLIGIEAAKPRFCQFFTLGQTCQYGASCKRAHLCDVLLADKSVCGAAHSRQGHVDTHGLPGY